MFRTAWKRESSRIAQTLSSNTNKSPGLRGLLFKTVRTCVSEGLQPFTVTCAAVWREAGVNADLGLGAIALFAAGKESAQFLLISLQARGAPRTIGALIIPRFEYSGGPLRRPTHNRA